MSTSILGCHSNNLGFRIQSHDCCTCHATAAQTLPAISAVSAILVGTGAPQAPGEQPDQLYFDKEAQKWYAWDKPSSAWS